MKIVGLTDKPHLAHAWWRIVRPFTELQKHGIDAKWCWLDAQGDPELDVKDAIVVLQRVIVKKENPEKFIQRLRELGAKKIVYELDDDILSDSYIDYLRGCNRVINQTHEKIVREEAVNIEWLISMCDAVTVPTEPLKELIEIQVEMYPNHIYIVPSAIDVSWFKSKLDLKKRDPKYIYIGWAGGLRPDEDFKEMVVAWREIAQEFDNVKFVIAGYQPDILHAALPEDKIIVVPVKSIEEYPSSMQVDIGCIPLARNAFNECKSPIKEWEFALAGALPISDHPMYKHSEWARDRINWYNLLKMYISSRRSLLVDQADIERDVMEDHNLAIEYKKWVEVYESISNITK